MGRITKRQETNKKEEEEEKANRKVETKEDKCKFVQKGRKRHL